VARSVQKARVCWISCTATVASNTRSIARGTNEWKRISWDEAFDRIAKLMKADRDANFVAKNADGLLVNRWLTTGMLAASASSNESGYITHKVVRNLGMLVFDNQARV
jgi:formate dehydrogenase major subunit